MRGLKRKFRPALKYWQISITRRHRPSFVFYMEYGQTGRFHVQVDGAVLHKEGNVVRWTLPNGIVWGCTCLEGNELINPFASMHGRWAAVDIAPFDLMK